jgi:hypothetical protein
MGDGSCCWQSFIRELATPSAFLDDAEMNTTANSPTHLPAPLITQLDTRDVALWLAGSGDGADPAATGRFTSMRS